MVLVMRMRHVVRRASLSKRVMARFSSTNVAAPSRVDDDLIANFQLLLEKRQATEAMQIFQSLKKPPATALSQRLAIMLAKRATLKDTKDAIDVLKSVYMNPTLKPDDFTMLAFIFVSDACYRNKMLKEAVEVTEEAHNLGVRLDLPAYNNLINALVDADQTDEAILILQDIAGGDVISPDETTYAGLISAIISQREFSQAMETIDQARTSGVKFSGETYMSFMSSLADVEDDSDAMDRLLTYLETSMDEDGIEAFEEFENAIIGHDDDDDDDDDGDNDNDDDDHDDHDDDGNTLH